MVRLALRQRPLHLVVARRHVARLLNALQTGTAAIWLRPRVVKHRRGAVLRQSSAWVVDEAWRLLAVVLRMGHRFELIVFTVRQAHDAVHTLRPVVVRCRQLRSLRMPHNLRGICLSVSPILLATLLLVILAAFEGPVACEFVGIGCWHQVLLLWVQFEQVFGFDDGFLGEDQDVVETLFAIVCELGLLPVESRHTVRFILHGQRLRHLGTILAEFAHAHVIVCSCSLAHRSRSRVEG
mmetsp:Transcript_24796/g.33178  ORF Transcript_24796/g.33178 Transcript_24796/m.33178 type:complete len:238 (-) Transcript_24796:312-1025(-)